MPLTVEYNAIVCSISYVRINWSLTFSTNCVRSKETDVWKVCRCCVQCYTWRNAIGSAVDQWNENSKLVVQRTYAYKTIACCQCITSGHLVKKWNSVQSVPFVFHLNPFGRLGNEKIFFFALQMTENCISVVWARRRIHFYFNFSCFTFLVRQNQSNSSKHSSK